ncbi:MAG: 2-phospho-L-lactate guanylyltransferase [Methanobacteriota archaeon]
MKTYVPFCPDEPKTRLSDVMTEEERVGFVHACLADVCDSVDTAGAEPVVLTTQPLDGRAGVADRYQTVVRDEPLTPAVNAVLTDEKKPVAVVVADLPLVTPDALRRLYEPDAGFVVVPGRGGGTNAFVTREDGFRVDYHGTSFVDHVERARKLGCSVEVVDSFRLSTDADEPVDLVESLLHGDGNAAGFVEDRFEVAEDGDDRVSLRRR